MLKKYYKEFVKIPFYKSHPECMPFVGDDYDKYKILQVAESHYIGQTDSDLKDGICANWTRVFDIEYMDKHWWDNSCWELSNMWREWYNTTILPEVHCLNKGKTGYTEDTIYTLPLETFGHVVLKRPVVNLDYNYFAFMNFFQMPSLSNGVKFQNSLVNSAKYINKPYLSDKVFNETIEISKETLDAVIDILEPRAVVITSISAGEAYQSKNAYNVVNGKYVNDGRMIYTTHTSRGWWKRKVPRLGNRTGEQVVEDGLNRIYNNASPASFANNVSPASSTSRVSPIPSNNNASTVKLPNNP